MKTNRILLAILLLIIACQTRNMLEPEIRKILTDKQNLSEVITIIGNTLSALKKEGQLKPTIHFETGDDSCKAICLSWKLPLIRVNMITLISPGRLNQNLEIMIVLKSDYFASRECITRFINENHINVKIFYSCPDA
ncbi:hypothetical protein QF042_002170 [Pedobacter sp. W3I1]|uniref:hypothetical protein n=1 Tax=Pedobacter sp. W3I1 TaxID=3042291 RepID=UPI00278B56F9|nr:hypothetical protein [Pedobacter sp. W3I1]MDQ0638605.1 hypothetical protein [Pedobacter sp. W3I1]